MLKIMMTTMGLDIGGAETHIVELSKELKRQGHDVLISSNGGVYVPEIEAEGIRHFCVPLNKRSITSMVKSYFMLRRIIKKEKPDIVHAHARIPAFLCAILKRKLNFPFVTTAHWVFDTSGGLKYLTNWGQKTIAVSEDIKEYLIQNYGIHKSDIYVTINGIDTDRFSPKASGSSVASEFGLDSNRPIISYVSRLDEDRALVARQLIDIAPELDQRLPGIQILIAGGGDVFDELNKKSDKMNLAAGRRLITMTGPRTDINEIISAGDLFIGVSRAALEAMSAGKPVIVAGNEGYLGLFSSDNFTLAQESNFCCRGCTASTGLLLLHDITHSLTEMSAEKRKALGLYGRSVIMEHYSVSKMTEDCLLAYEAVRKKRYKIVMSGYYGFNNSGDEAILHSIHRNIELSDVDASITVLSNDPVDTKRRYGYNAVHRFSLPSVLKAIRNCDVLISGGGSLLQDRTSTRSILYYLFIIRTAEFMGKKVMLYANGIGPVTKRSNRRRVRKAVEKADLVTLRDHSSARELRDMGVQRELFVTADPVFTLNSVPPEQAAEIMRKTGVPTDKPFVGVSIRNWSCMEDFCKKTAVLCDTIYENYDCNIVFIVMQSPNDIEISRSVQDLMCHPSYILDGQYSAEELMGMIGAADFVLAMRLHTLIFAARMKVPAIGLVYDPKIEYYLETLSMPSIGRVENYDLQTALSVIQQVAENKPHYVSILDVKTTALEYAAHQDELYLKKLLGS